MPASAQELSLTAYAVVGSPVPVFAYSFKVAELTEPVTPLTLNLKKAICPSPDALLRARRRVPVALFSLLATSSVYESAMGLKSAACTARLVPASRPAIINPASNRDLLAPFPVTVESSDFFISIVMNIPP